MFKKSDEPFIDLRKYSVVHLYHSLNEPIVSMGSGQAAGPARAFILTCQSRPTVLENFVGLFFAQTGDRLLFSAFPFPPEQINDRIADAEGFVSQMGFMMENLHFERSSRDQRKELMRTVPFVYEQVEHFFQALSPTERDFMKQKKPEVGGSSVEPQIDNAQAFLEQYLRIASML